LLDYMAFLRFGVRVEYISLWVVLVFFDTDFTNCTVYS